MNVNHLSNAEIEACCKNPDLLTAHAKEIRAQLIVGIIESLTGRFASLIKIFLRKSTSAFKHRTQPEKMKSSGI